MMFIFKNKLFNFIKKLRLVPTSKRDWKNTNWVPWNRYRLIESIGSGFNSVHV